MSGSPSNAYTVDVYAERLYTIKFFDATAERIRTVTGKVLGVSTDTIALMQTSMNSGASNVCLNNNQDKLSDLVSTQMYSIPVANIASCVPVLDACDTAKPTTTERSERIVAVIGLSSTVVRAIIVEIKVFDDDVEHAVNHVTMEVGGKYHVVYASNDGKCDTLYEIEGRLLQIQEVQEFGSEPNLNGYVRADCPHGTEQVGYQGNTYNTDYFMNLPKQNPDANRIKFIFDTSEKFERSFDSCTLGQIRNVYRVEDTKPYPPEPNPDPWPCPNPDPAPCPPPVQKPHRPAPQPYPPHYDPYQPPAPPPSWMQFGPWGQYFPTTPPPVPPQPPIRWEHPDHPGCDYNSTGGNHQW